MPRSVPTHRPAQSALKPRRGDAHRDTQWRRFINSRAWRKCSKSYLAEHPLCVRCLGCGLIVAATDVHHTMGQSEEHAFDPATFEALCAPCHSRQTRADQNAAQEGGG